MLGHRQPLGNLNQEVWDLVVIGGGITGAGILLESARLGKKVLLLEQQDFAWGTSSRSSKMVHGGLRYIAQGDITLTKHSLTERERLLTELPHMVVRFPYIFPIRQGSFPGRLAMEAVLTVYDKLAGISDHNWIPRDKLLAKYPDLNATGLKGGMRYTDALVDDVRLVLRVLHEAVLEGGTANHYSEVKSIAKSASGFTLRVEDKISGEVLDINAAQVVNATGAWADLLSADIAKVRPQRGSHIFILEDKLPVQDCLTVMHPDDGRPVFIYPWKGQTCIGTTDLDHREAINLEPHCTAAEIDYLLKVANQQFAAASITRADIISTIAGVRPIIASGKGSDPSKERRDHLVWTAKNGVVSVSGGKLTTFRLIALDVLSALGWLDSKALKNAQTNTKLRCFNHRIEDPDYLNAPLVKVATGTALLSQVTWILQNEMVQHLDDLMLRRLRAGNLLVDGGREVLAQIKPLCLEHLAWDEAHWQAEVTRYQEIIRRSYAVL
ncbi:glycerol-3-phosphate dehydrogenase/oxidase [Aquirhabdus sp.]|uniref:glycerol-3-phosphate dehydrogenase/oxidase n=1 Tax=Aquirhabdus sp. TaxID=2824160 RepID=UPI00396C5959